MISNTTAIYAEEVLEGKAIGWLIRYNSVLDSSPIDSTDEEVMKLLRRIRYGYFS